MSKFLPFINSSSGPKAVFKAILKRSKGSSTKAVADLFTVLVHIGMDEATILLDAMPNSMTMTEKIKKLVNDNVDITIGAENLDYWTSIIEILITLKVVKTPPFHLYSTMLAVLVIKTPDEVEEVSPGLVIDDYKTIEEVNDLPNLTSVSFDINAENRVGFSGLNQLQAFVSVLESKKEDICISPVFLETETDFEAGKKRCKSVHAFLTEGENENES